MNRIPQDKSAAEPREVVQVTLDGTAEICAATGLTCMGFQFLMFVHGARSNKPAQAQAALDSAKEIAEKILDTLTPRQVMGAHAKFHSGER